VLQNQWWQRLFSSIDAKSARDFASFLSEDASFRYGSGPEVHGRNAVEQHVAAVFDSFRYCTHDVQQRWELPDCRICRGIVTYTMLDYRRVALPFCNVLTLRGELIERYEIFIDPTPLMSASQN
jgi:hypothetical protein